MYVKEIWRYPVKSMAGERLEHANITELGITNDRVILSVDARGRAITARTHPALLGHRGSTGQDGVPLVDGRPSGRTRACWPMSVKSPGSKLN